VAEKVARSTGMKPSSGRRFLLTGVSRSWLAHCWPAPPRRLVYRSGISTSGSRGSPVFLTGSRRLSRRRGWSRLECGSFGAPRNWNRPQDNIDVVIAVSRLRPATGAVQGSVLTNPGGPGLPGRLLPLVFLARRRAKLLDHLTPSPNRQAPSAPPNSSTS
jgi:hypothetical protein